MTTPIQPFEPTSGHRVGWLGLIIILALVAGLLRFYQLGDKSVWHDEAYTLLVAARPIQDIPRAIFLSENHPPLTYLLLHFWARLTRHEWLLRLPFALCGVGAVLALFALGHRVLPRSTRFGAAFLLALNGFHLYYSQEIRNYAIAVFLFTLMTFLFFEVLDKPRRQAWLAFILCSVIAFYTEYMTFFLFVNFNLWALLHYRRYRARLPGWIGAQILIALLYLPWVLYTAQNLTRVIGESFWLDQPGLRAIKDVIDCGLGIPLLTSDWSWLTLGNWGLGLGIAGLLVWEIVRKWTDKQTQPYRDLLLFCLLQSIIPVALFFCLSHLVNPIFHPRFFIWFLPGFDLMLAIVLFENLPRPGWYRPLNWLAAGLSVLLLLQNGLNLQQYDQGQLYEKTRRSDFKAAANFIRQHWRSGDRIIHYEPFTNMPFRYYLPEERQYQLIIRPTRPEAGTALSDDTGQADVPYYLGGTFCRPGEGVTDLDLFMTKSPRIWLIGFAEKSYPGPSERFHTHYSLTIQTARSFQGALVALAIVSPK